MSNVSHYIKRIIAATMLTCGIAAGAGAVSTVTTEAATYNGVYYSANYTEWLQGAAAWGSKTLGNLCRMSDSGCLITSIAIQMARSGVENTITFNPGVLRDRLESKGFISHANNKADDGNLNTGLAFSQSNSPNFYVAGSSDFHPTPFSQIASTLYSKTKAGYYAVVQVNYGSHWVAVSSCTGSEVYINDPASNGKTSLRQYDGGIERAIYFKANKYNSPQGNIDSITASNGTIRVSGWAFDRDSLGSSLAIHVYVGGPAGSGAPGYAITANKSRTDVGKAFPGVGNNHGFDSTISTTKTGTQTVYVYAINAGGGSTNTYLGCKTVTIPSTTIKKGTFTLKNYNYPTSLNYGKSFSVCGTITSTTKMKKCIVGVYTTSGKFKTGRSWNPKSKSVNIKTKADSYVLFNKLPKGTYYYRVKATNASGTKTLLNKKFYVR